MRKINILCDGGLGNRLNALVGGLVAAEAARAEPIIFWPENNSCGCSYRDLFDGQHQVSNQGIRHVFTQNPHAAFLIHENQINAPIKKLFRHRPESLSLISSSGDDIVYYHNSIPDWISSRRVLEVLQSIPVNRTIVERARDYSSRMRIDASVWGILLRKTDYASNPSINRDSEELQNYISEDGRARYYICSDDKATEDAWGQLKNVHVYPKTSYVEKYRPGGWNDPIVDDQGRESTFNVNRPRQSVIEAFTALLILSRTTLALDSPSTFLAYAKLYANFDLKVGGLSLSRYQFFRRLVPTGPRQFSLRRRLRNFSIPRLGNSVRARQSI